MISLIYSYLILMLLILKNICLERYNKLAFYSLSRILSSFSINFSFASILSICLFFLSSSIFLISNIASVILLVLHLPANIHKYTHFLEFTI